MAEYLFALKGNQDTLLTEVRDSCTDPAALEAAMVAGNVLPAPVPHDKRQGRIEERNLTATDHLDWMDAKERRPQLDLRSLIHLRSVRVWSMKAAARKTDTDTTVWCPMLANF